MIEYMKKNKNFKEVMLNMLKKNLLYEQKMGFLNFNILNKLKSRFVCQLFVNI